MDELDLTPTIPFGKVLGIIDEPPSREQRRRELNRLSARRCSANKAAKYAAAKRKVDRLHALFAAQPRLKSAFPDAWAILA
jgi:hypothetical protein